MTAEERALRCFALFCRLRPPRAIARPRQRLGPKKAGPGEGVILVAKQSRDMTALGNSNKKQRGPQTLF
eukprot:4546732-Pyramimonas_sp.AAC.1